jgi:hypothetical protein
MHVLPGIRISNGKLRAEHYQRLKVSAVLARPWELLAYCQRYAGFATSMCDSIPFAHALHAQNVFA